MKGTINSAAEPILLIPPNIIRARITTKIPAVMFTLRPKALLTDIAIEFA